MHDGMNSRARCPGGAPARVERWGAGLLCAAALAAAFVAGCDDPALRRFEGELQVVERIDFGAVTLGADAAQELELRNVGRAPLRVVPAPPEDTSPAEFRPDESGPAVLQPGESRMLRLHFTPQALGARSGRLVLDTDSERHPQARIELAGEGVFGKVELSTRRLDFGKVGLGRQLTLAFELRNEGEYEARVRVPDAAGVDGEAFAVVPRGVMFVAAGQSRTIEVTFTASRLGAHAAEIAVERCFGCAPETVELIGEGVAAVLVADPPLVEFGALEPGNTAQRVVRIGNLGRRAARLTGVRIESGAAAGFALEPLPSGGVELAGESWYELPVRFTPAALGQASGAVLVDTLEEETAGLLRVLLSGFGGGPQVEVLPPAVAFAATGVGMVLERRITIRNGGYDPDGTHPLVLQDFRVESAAGSTPFTVLGVDVAPGGALAVGEARTLVVRYAPVLPGPSAAALHIETNDADQPLVVVPLSGSARDLGACAYTLAPQRVDFGAIRQGSTATLAFALRNIGANPCAVANVRLSASTATAFALSPVEDQIVDPGRQLQVFVTFAPAADGAFAGAVELDVSDPAAPHISVPLGGTAVPSCLEIAPDTVDFGVVGLQCQPPVRTVAIRNACAVPVAVSGARIGGAPTTEFSITAGAGARSVLPGQETRVDLAYAPVDEGDDLAPLYLSTDRAAVPLLVTLKGRGRLRPTHTDVFAHVRERVDFLFVIDNSGSMAEEQDAISRNFDRFVRAADARGVDYHLGVTTTGLTPFHSAWSVCPGGADGGEAGRLFPIDHSRPRILERTTPAVREAFAANVRVGVCHWEEFGLEAARLALSSPLADSADAPNTPAPDDGNAGFLREDASLYLLFVSDEDDAGTVPPSTYVAFLKGLKPGRPELVHASGILGLPTCATAPSTGTRYQAVVNAFGGIVGDICDSDWGALLQRIGDDAFAPRLSYPLSQPSDGRALSVALDGTDLAATAPGGTRHWHFDPAAGPFGSVVFERDQAPPPGSTVELTYTVPCGA